MSYKPKNYRTDGGNTTVIGGKLKFTDDAEVENFPGGEGGSGEYTLPAATETTLGGVKVGEGLSITEDGVLSANGITPAANVPESSASNVAGIVTDLNALLSSLKAAGLMAADE